MFFFGKEKKDVYPMMHLLCKSFNRGDSADDLHMMLRDVYRNFTSIHKAVIALLETLGRNCDQDSYLLDKYRWTREVVGMLITFCRWQLNWMLNEDKVKSKTSALLLEEIESRLFMIIKGFTLHFEHVKILVAQIEPIYQAAVSSNESSFMPSYLLIANEFILEFINQVYEDLYYEQTESNTAQEQFILEFLNRIYDDLNYVHHENIVGFKERKTMRGYLLLLKYYFEFTADRINGEEMNDFLISSQLLASRMAYYCFFIRFNYLINKDREFAGIRIESDIRLGCLRTTLALPQHISGLIPAMNNELLIIYVNCIQDNLSRLLDEAFTDLTSSTIDQFTVLQSQLSFLIFLLAGSRSVTIGQGKLSDIRVRFHVLVRNVGSLILSCFNNEMNGNIIPSLSDFIDNVNLIKEESIEIMEGSVIEVREMHLLNQCVGGAVTSDDLHHMLKYVYRNFTSIHKSVIALLENLLIKFHHCSDLLHEYHQMREQVGMVITFCRWQLNCMVNEDKVGSKSSASLLEKTESHLIMIRKALADHLCREELDFSAINDLRVGHIHTLLDDIEPFYEASISRNEASFMPSYLLIANEFILEFIDQVFEDLKSKKDGEEFTLKFLNLNQVHDDFHHNAVEVVARKTMSEYMVLLKYYFEFIADRIDGEEMNDFLISSQLVASKMAYYSFISKHTISNSWETKFASNKHRIESDIRLGCLRVYLVLPKHVSSSIIAAMNNELLTIYVNCIHDNLSGHLKDKAFIDLTSPIIDQLTVLPTGLSMILLPDSGLPTAADAEKLSNIRVWFRALVRSVGFLTTSCLNDGMKGSLTSMLCDLIIKVDLMKEEIIENMYCIVLGGPGQESPRTHRLHFLIILFENLEDLMDNRSSLIMTQKDQSDAVHMNLILLRSFIQNFKGNSTAHEGSENIDELDFSEKDELMKTLAKKMHLLRNYLQLHIDQINAEEMSELVISAQVTAFEMACYLLLRKYGEVHWWKVYVQTKDLVDSHMRIGVLRAAVQSLEGSSNHPLSDELLIGYVDCMLDNMTELVKDEASDRMKAQFERLHQELSSSVLLLYKHCTNQEKLSDIKLFFQALLRNIGSVICSCFNNQSSNLVTEHSIGIADLVEKLDFLQEETQGFQYTFILQRIRQEFPKVHLPGFFDLLLDNWKEFMDCESDTVRNNKEQCQAIHETLVLFRSFIQNLTTSPTEDEESQKLCKLIAEAGYVAEYLLDSFVVEACTVSCTSHWIPVFMEHIKLIEARIMEVNRKKLMMRSGQ